jgi:hypothetical protein
VHLAEHTRPAGVLIMPPRGAASRLAVATTVLEWRDSSTPRGRVGIYDLLLHYVSPSQVNAFVPQEVVPSFYNSQVDVYISTPTGTMMFPVDFRSLAPALFRMASSDTHLLCIRTG